MKLLLKEDVEGLGVCGDEVEVKDGYGRNFLVPQGKAIHATPKNVKAFNHQKSIVQVKLKKIVNSATSIAENIEKIPCTITKKVGDQGKLFGSVTTQEIAALLRAGGVEVDKRKIHLEEPIRSLGEFKVPIKLHPQVTAMINVTVVAEQEPEKAEEAKPEASPEKAEEAKSEASPEGVEEAKSQESPEKAEEA